MGETMLKIKKLEETDFESWRALWKEYLEFYETQVDDVIYKTTFQRLVSKENTIQNALIANKANKLVGLVHFIFHPHNWIIEDVCYLQDLFVSVDSRGCGVGRALIEAVYHISDNRQVPKVYWLTQDFNKQARMLYDKIATVTPFIKYNR